MLPPNYRILATFRLSYPAMPAFLLQSAPQSDTQDHLPHNPLPISARHISQRKHAVFRQNQEYACRFRVSVECKGGQFPHFYYTSSVNPTPPLPSLPLFPLYTSLEHPSLLSVQPFSPPKKIFDPLLTTLRLCSPIKSVPAVRSRRMHRKGADK